MDFDKCLNDQCLLIRRNDRGTVIIGLYIDYALVIGDDDSVQEFKREINNISGRKRKG